MRLWALSLSLSLSLHEHIPWRRGECERVTYSVLFYTRNRVSWMSEWQALEGVERTLFTMCIHHHHHLGRFERARYGIRGLSRSNGRSSFILHYPFYRHFSLFHKNERRNFISGNTVRSSTPIRRWSCSIWSGLAVPWASLLGHQQRPFTSTPTAMEHFILMNHESNWWGQRQPNIFFPFPYSPLNMIAV